MKTPKHDKAVKAAVFAAFVFFSIAAGISWNYFPTPPTRVDGEPYSVSLSQLRDYAAEMEGQPVIIMPNARNVSFNTTSDILTFQTSHILFDFTVTIVYYNWTENGTYPVGQLENGSSVVVTGICRVESAGSIVGTRIVILLPENVYVASIGGLAIIVVLVLVYFKIDFKKLAITRKTRDGVKRP
nr:hypothetical protein [Candidatus Sigynarchaeota archaeon]